MLAWPQPIRQDPLQLGRSRRGHTPAHTAPGRTAPPRDRLRQPMAASPRAGHGKPGRTPSGDPMWLGLFKGFNVFSFFQKSYFLFEKP
jgi:hypothetical protein